MLLVDSVDVDVDDVVVVRNGTGVGLVEEELLVLFVLSVLLVDSVDVDVDDVVVVRNGTGVGLVEEELLVDFVLLVLVVAVEEELLVLYESVDSDVVV
jgi:hypothetical protein